jgi:hypothetical protein
MKKALINEKVHGIKWTVVCLFEKLDRTDIIWNVSTCI